jgi:membrane-associated phospholipid phosphatase
VYAFLETLAHFDRLVLELSENFRWEPLTVLFIVASSTWVKGVVFVAAGGACDIGCRRRFPTAATAAATSLAAAATLVFVLKDALERSRPELAHPGTADPLVTTPTSHSFPSGHTATAFATATVIALLHPRLRWPAFALAALVGLSRVYLGVHFLFDVLAGAALGIAVGWTAVWAARRLRERFGGATEGARAT